MKKLLFLLFSVSLSTGAQNDSVVMHRVRDYFLTKSLCYSNLEELCTKIGGRLSGSPQAAEAVEWAAKKMREAGADSVFLQPVRVPVWVRGKKERCDIVVAGKKTGVSCVALGSSVGTGAKGIKAEVLEVNSFDDLDKKKDQVKGKIVFYNVFFDRSKIRTGSAYGEAVTYRYRGPSKAAKYGAVATLVRSIGSATDDEPHTGMMAYDTSESKTKIPALALGYQSADRLVTAISKNPHCEIQLFSDSEMRDSVMSFNVVGQITGNKKPKEYIIAGGHLDSWDNGQGAHDDGAGVVHCIGVLEAYKTLGIKPQHSIRAVAFMNEENGLMGGKAYAADVKKYKEKHLAAIESDAGGFVPRGFGVDTTGGLFDLVNKHRGALSMFLIDRIEKGGDGADIGPLDRMGVPCIGFEPDTQRYFDLHHTAADTFDKVSRRELELGSASITALIYLLDTHLD